jgi:hypothetical protein
VGHGESSEVGDILKSEDYRKTRTHTSRGGGGGEGVLGV